MMTHGMPPHTLWLLQEHAALIGGDRAEVEANLASGVAFMHAPDEPVLQELLRARDHDPDAERWELGERLKRDHARLRAGWRPGTADLADAPILLDAEALIAIKLGPEPTHQVVLSGWPVDEMGRVRPRPWRTSLLIAVEAHQGLWVRTYNRFYRLMRSDEDGGAQVGPWAEAGR